MKKLPILCFTALFTSLFAPLAPLRAQQAPNPYDTLSHVITPIASIFSPEAQKHALSATFVLEEMTGLPPELAGSRFELLLEPPERFLIRGNYQGKPVTICRAGNSVWITPAEEPFTALANPPGQPVRHKKNQPATLAPMVLPFPPQQLALLPILFQVKEALPEQEGQRVLKVSFMADLAKNLGLEDWSAKLSLSPTEKLERLRLLGPGWTLALRVERLEIAKSLPPETWQPRGDAIRLDAAKVEQWTRELSNQVDAYRPAPSR